MDFVVFALLAALQANPSQDTFGVSCDLQGLYDEMAQATAVSYTARDVDLYHGVFYTPDWVFVDAQGQRHPWTELRDQTISQAGEHRFDAIYQVLQDATITADGATTTIDYIVVRSIDDRDGKYGKAGAKHTIAEVTALRDTWSKTGVVWRLKMREQLGGTKEYVDKMPPDIAHRRCPPWK